MKYDEVRQRFQDHLPKMDEALKAVQAEYRALGDQVDIFLSALLEAMSEILPDPTEPGLIKKTICAALENDDFADKLIPRLPEEQQGAFRRNLLRTRLLAKCHDEIEQLREGLIADRTMLCAVLRDIRVSEHHAADAAQCNPERLYQSMQNQLGAAAYHNKQSELCRDAVWEFEGNAGTAELERAFIARLIDDQKVAPDYVSRTIGLNGYAAKELPNEVEHNARLDFSDLPADCLANPMASIAIVFGQSTIRFPAPAGP